MEMKERRVPPPPRGVMNDDWAGVYVSVHPSIPETASEAN